MNMDIRGMKFELGEELEAHIARRLRFALRRFEDRIDRVTCRLSDVNGPRGGIDKECLIRVALVPRGGVRFKGSGHDPFALVSLAAKRVGRSVRRALARQRRVYA